MTFIIGTFKGRSTTNINGQKKNCYSFIKVLDDNGEAKNDKHLIENNYIKELKLTPNKKYKIYFSKNKDVNNYISGVGKIEEINETIKAPTKDPKALKKQPVVKKALSTTKPDSTSPDFQKNNLVDLENRIYNSTIKIIDFIIANEEPINDLLPKSKNWTIGYSETNQVQINKSRVFYWKLSNSNITKVFNNYASSSGNMGIRKVCAINKAQFIILFRKT